MIVDGKKIANDILADLAAEVQAMPQPPRLTIFTCAPNFETEKFLRLKQLRAAEVGIAITLITLPATVTLPEVEAAITAATPLCDAMIVQFPFPHLQTADLIPLVPPSHDVDVMQYAGLLDGLFPPVVGAIDVIAKVHQVDFAGKHVVIVGNGRLVGAPACLYATARGAQVTILTKENFAREPIAAADILILGAGVPGLVTSDMVRQGVVVFDAGTSEEGGQLVGDADPRVSTVASIYTPVPGGIGPITIAVLLRNVVALAKA
jgi:methylenetetrahydrofolate dehydrogenase (NADP+) / methenyltetrahydrofolate cyclohydrolase